MLMERYPLQDSRTGNICVQVCRCTQTRLFIRTELKLSLFRAGHKTSIKLKVIPISN